MSGDTVVSVVGILAMLFVALIIFAALVYGSRR